MTADAGIVAKLQRYCEARGIEPRSPEYRSLLAGHRNSPNFGELLDKELARIGAAKANGGPNDQAD